jgi:hypothetical protein
LEFSEILRPALGYGVTALSAQRGGWVLSSSAEIVHHSERCSEQFVRATGSVFRQRGSGQKEISFGDEVSQNAKLFRWA